MTTASQMKRIYDILTLKKWRIVNKRLGSVTVGEDRLTISACDGTTLCAVLWGEKVEVWAYENGDIKVWALVDLDVTDIDFDWRCGAVDFAEVLGRAKRTVAYDDVYGYLADVSPDVGDRLLVIEFLQEEEG
jgi:hypothetical protein